MINIVYKILLLVLSTIIFWSCKERYPESKLKIAYNVFSDEVTDDYDIYIMNLDGSDPHAITHEDGVEWTYNAAGEKLFFISDRDTCDRCFYLYESDTKGKSWRKVSDTRVADSWIGSRYDGQELIIKPYTNIEQRFDIIDLTGKVLYSIRPTLPYISDPCFSPDGSQIVFRGGQTANKSIEGFKGELYIMNDDGSDMHTLTTYPAQDTTAKWYEYRAGPPRWNSASNEITYCSTQQNSHRIYTIHPDSTLSSPITQSTVKSYYHDISSDGRYMVYDGQLDYKSENRNYHIFLRDNNTRQITKLTQGDGVRQAPVFVYEK